MIERQGYLNLPTKEYLANINELSVNVVNSPTYLDPKTNFISDSSWKTLVKGGVLSASLGDRDITHHQEEIMQTLRILSYHDINLGLTYGITTALVIKVIQRFAGSAFQREKYLNEIRNGERMGLAITEKNSSGSSALEMNDSNYKVNDNGTATLNFSKHLQGLSGNSGLIVAARKLNTPTTTIGLFLVDKKDINTRLVKTMGLGGIAYGVNTGSVTLNLSDHLMTEIPRRELLTFQNLFTESRLYFVGMPLGHMEHMEQEANSYASKRLIGGVFQKDMPVPSYKLKIIKARRLASEAIFNHVKDFRVSGKSLMEGNTMEFATEASIIKALPSEYAVATAADRAELMGGASFYEKGALQDYLDIWPFKIFEGTRWMLNTQIGHASGKSISETNGDERLFNRVGALANLSSESKKLIEEIKVTKKGVVQEEIIGQIQQRIFALGCIRQKHYTSEDYLLVTNFLNLEIRQLGLEYFSKIT